MGAQLSKGGVAAEGKAVVADPAAAKANGQVSKAGLTSRASVGSHMAPNAHRQHECHGGARGSDGCRAVALSDFERNQSSVSKATLEQSLN